MKRLKWPIIDLIPRGVGEKSISAPCASDSTQINNQVKIVLAGDSTVTFNKGWGTGFTAQLNQDMTVCVNLAQGGRSSKSYRDEGYWSKVLEEKPDWLIIQFGHNDRPGKGPKLESDPQTTFPDNLERFIDEARDINAKPVLVTPLTKRYFSTEDDKIHSDLSLYAEATKRIGIKKQVPVIDLHTKSIQLFEMLGRRTSFLFGPQKEQKVGKEKLTHPDLTHLNELGGQIIGTIVVEELVHVVPEMEKLFLEIKMPVVE